jgi:hypothetical protein
MGGRVRRATSFRAQDDQVIVSGRGLPTRNKIRQLKFASFTLWGAIIRS